MRNAETVLAAIRERGRRGLPLERVYRLLFNRELYLLAYGRLYRNDGALTAGATIDTVDGMSLAKIDALIAAVRQERYRWTPARRVYVEKKHSAKKRPLGLPTWSDKLLQEVIRLILDAYYEPQFSQASHGFRSGRGCHTALRQVQRTWTGTTWFVEGDIAACFDRLDHDVLVAILAEKLHDGRFLRLIGGLLAAGYLEDWRFNATLSGVPQGGVASPILSNIYLDRLDRFVETTLLPAYNRGTERRDDPTYSRLRHRAGYLARTGHRDEARALREQFQRLPSCDPTDPGYRRLRYVRYADDFLLGFSGPRAEAEAIKAHLAAFLRDQLKLELSEAKTLVTHARTQPARFLGYEVLVVHDDTKRDQRGNRRLHGAVGLRVPADVIRAKCASYLLHSKPIHRAERLNDSVFSVVEQYQAEYRGVVGYYRLAHNLHRFTRLQWVMGSSLSATLAGKLKLSRAKVWERLGTTAPTARGPRRVLRVVVERTGKAPLVAQWGGISLARDTEAVLDDQPPRVWNARTELLERLLADTCELCGSRVDVQVHHVRRLKDLQTPGQAPKPAWVRQMAARRRKTLVVCRACHGQIHRGGATHHAHTE